MATRTALLNGNVINRDTDFSKHIEAVSEPWVISWFAVSSSSVAVWEAFVKCERTNGDVIYALVYNTAAQSISGDGDVYIEVSQEIIDNWELGNEDGTEIAEIKVGTMPAKNALKLATKSWSTVTDARNMIKKVGELKTLIDTNTAGITDLDTRVESLEEAAAIANLQDSALVGELYEITDDMFKQLTPTLANSTLDCPISNTSGNSEIHIQRLGSGVASNQLKIKVKMVGESTQNLKVEVRKWLQVTVTADSEAYWYGDEVVATGSIAYTDIGSTYAEKTVTMSANFGATKGELLDIVLYMDTVNASNYYCIACDETQGSEWLSYVAVNSTTRTRSNMMPYCVSDWVATAILAKVKDRTEYAEANVVSRVVTSIAAGAVDNSGSINNVFTWVATTSWSFTFNYTTSGSTTWYLFVHVNWEQAFKQFVAEDWGGTATFTCFKGDKVVVSIGDKWSSGGTVYMYGTDVTQTKVYLLTPSTALAIKPQSVEELWELGVGTLYGRHPNDWVYYGGIMTEKSTDATTGNIAPWNFVGYITVNLNGEIVKIPYYNN